MMLRVRYGTLDSSSPQLYLVLFCMHYEVAMSGALMANYSISWRLENNVMSSKYLVMRALHDH